MRVSGARVKRDSGRVELAFHRREALAIIFLPTYSLVPSRSRNSMRDRPRKWLRF